jgi:hypothetical protein
MVMKKFFILALGTLIGTSALAQIQPASGPSPLKFGVKAGISLPKYNFSNTDGDDVSTKTTTNFHVTGYLDAPIGAYFSIQPGISLQGKGGKFSENEDLDTKSEQNTMWIEVPVNLVGKIPVGMAGTNVFLGAGPYLSFGISGENKLTVGSTETKTDVNFGKDEGNFPGTVKGTDFGVNFLGGVQLNNAVTIGAGYGLGLTDLRPSEEGGNGKITNRVLSFSVGYAF